MPIFGDVTAGGDSFPCSNDRGLFGLFTLTEDGTATEIAVRFDASSGAGSNAKGLIYTSAGALVVATTGQAVPAGGGLLTWVIDVALTAGNYYLGSVTSDFQPTWQCDTGTGQRVEGVTYASPSATMGTLNSTGAIPDVYVTYTVGAAPAVDQEGFRFGVDDGSESAHTWSGVQDNNVTSPLSQNLLLRALLNGTGDYANVPFKLKYQKNGTGGYVDVPVGASVAESYGTVTFGAYGTGANGGATVAPTYPAGITAGQYLTLHVSSGATNNETPTTPSGWTLLATGTSTDGTYGVDAGPRRMTVFGKIAAGTESGTVTVSITNGGTCRGSIARWTKAGSGSWDVVAQGANDSTSGTGVSMTGASMNWNTGDAVIMAVAQRVDSATQSAQSLTASGVTFGTRTNRETTAVTTGNDHRHVIDTFAAVTGTSNVNAAPTWAYTASASVSAGGVFVRLREYTAPVNNEVYVSPSANIAAGGEATTARLTAPAGKTTGNFTTGRRWDDENGTDSVDIAADFYTELEWCLQAQSPAVNDDFFDFRVYNSNTALDTYTVTPRWTIGTATQTGSQSESMALSEIQSAIVTLAASITESAGTAADLVEPSGYAAITESAGTAAEVGSASYAGVAAITESSATGEEYSYPAGSVVPALIAAVATGASSSAGGTSAAFDTTGATQLRVIVESQINTLTNGALTDNQGNSYVIDSGPTTIGTFPGYAYVYRPSAAPTVGAGHTFTLNAAGCWGSTYVEAVGPSAGGTVSVATVANVQDTRPYVTGSITPAQDNALLLGWAGDDSTGANVAWAWTSPSTIISGATINDHGSFWGGSVGQRTVTAAGSYTMEVTNSGSGGSGVAIIHSYTEVTSGGPQTAAQSETAAVSDTPSALAAALAAGAESSAVTVTESADGANSASQVESSAAADAPASTKATASSVTEVVAGAPAFGDSQNDYQLDGAGFSPQLVTIDTQSGQVVCLCVLGDSGTQQVPTDNYGNSYTGTLLDTQNYFGDAWFPYNMRVYAKTGITGGAGHALSVVKSSSPAAEATLVAISVSGTTIQDHSVVARQTTGAGGDHVSNPVTTTGPALLLSFWSGDGNLAVANLDTEPLTGTGWTLLHMVGLEATAHIQHALAIKVVEAGTHTITWHNLGDQGCIISLIAIQGGTLAELTSSATSIGGVVSESSAASETESSTSAGVGSVTEATAVAETQSSGGDQSGSAVESSAVVETPASLAVMTAAAAESSAVADTPAGSYAGVAASAEAAAVAETQAGGNSAVAAGSDSAAVAATHDADSAGVQTATQAESSTVSEVESALMVGLATESESAAAADAPDSVKSTSAASSEAAGAASESQDGTNLGGITIITESAAASHSQQASNVAVSTSTEQAAASEAQSGGALGVASATEPSSVSETSDRTANKPAAGADSIASSDTATSTSDSGLSIIVESSAATQSQVALAAAGAAGADALTANALQSGGGLTSVTHLESIALAEIVSALRTVFSAMVEASGTSESSSTQSASVGIRVESSAVADVPVGTITFTMADILEAAVLAETVNSTLPQAGITESAGVADVVNWVREIASGGTRVYTISDENRTLTITTENRIYTVSTR